jgi:hypothetical protein
VTKNSKSVVDSLLNSLYDDIISVCSYEQDMVEIMIDLKCTLSEALEVDFDINLVDKSSVIGIVDYLEYRLKGDLNKVNLLMKIYTGQTPDFELVKL